MPPDKGGDDDDGDGNHSSPPSNPPTVHFADPPESPPRKMPNDNNDKNDIPKTDGEENPNGIDKPNDNDIPNSVDDLDTNDLDDNNSAVSETEDEHGSGLSPKRKSKPRSNTGSSGRTAVSNFSASSSKTVVGDEHLMTKAQLVDFFRSEIKGLHDHRATEEAGLVEEEKAFKSRLLPYLQKDAMSMAAVDGALEMFYAIQTNAWEDTIPKVVVSLIDVLLAVAIFKEKVAPAVPAVPTVPTVPAVPAATSTPAPSVSNTLSSNTEYADLHNDFDNLTTNLTNFSNRVTTNVPTFSIEPPDVFANATLNPQLIVDAFKKFGDDMAKWSKDIIAAQDEHSDRIVQFRDSVEEKLATLLQHKDQQIATLTTNLEDVNALLKQTDADSKNEMAKLRVEMKGLVGDLTKTVSGLKDEVSGLKSEKVEMKNDIVVLKNRVGDLEGDNTTLTEKVETLTGDNTTLTERVNTLSTQQLEVLQTLGILEEGQVVTETSLVQLTFEIVKLQILAKVGGFCTLREMLDYLGEDILIIAGFPNLDEPITIGNKKCIFRWAWDRLKHVKKAELIASLNKQFAEGKITKKERDATEKTRLQSLNPELASLAIKKAWTAIKDSSDPVLAPFKILLDEKNNLHNVLKKEVFCTGPPGKFRLACSKEIHAARAESNTYKFAIDKFGLQGDADFISNGLKAFDARCSPGARKDAEDRRLEWCIKKNYKMMY
ncbi:hypothetical protein SCHPADRAFT_942502 [Schizopora paradoxa]|uniref:Uncharacterized protein n=1 Tax=Schizopora paradoxa TaxID=27342 RepID=A0A0H2RGE1_9AGAM|nr:hypothetical protein SCHPADRAFT_942502 [Schizopora paradoxa]